MKTSVVASNKNIMFNDIKFGSNKRVSNKPVINNTNNSFNSNSNANPQLQQINQSNISTSSYNNLLNNGNNVNLHTIKYKDFTYNEEFYETLGKNTVLPIIEQTGATKLLNQITQNHNASISTTTGQYSVSNNFNFN
ncbi:MAG: hypothetical protein ACK5YA_00650 [bacterium]